MGSRTIAMTKLIQKSIDRTGMVLFKPFSVRKWIALIFVAFLAGALSSGGGASNPFQRNRNQKQEASQTPATQTSAANQATAKVSSAATTPQPPAPTPLQNLQNPIPAIFLIGITGFIFMVLMMILFSWLGARFKFVWLHDNIKNASEIKAPFREYKTEGNSLFKFFIFFGLGVLTYFIILGGIGLFLAFVLDAFRPGYVWSFQSGLLVFGVPGILIFISLFVLSFIGLLVEDIILPIMILDRVHFKEAWQRASKIYKENAGDLWLYYFVKLGLGILSGIAETILILIALFALLLIGLVVFGFFYVLAVGLFKANAIFIVIAILLGIPYGIVSIVTLMGMTLPIAVFFKSLALYYLTSLNVGYVPLRLEE
jgi:hypothetical protein